MDTIIDLDEPPIFRREEWIGKKKTYSWKDLPYFMINACQKALPISPHKMSRFPAHNIAVNDLLKKILPPHTSALVIWKPKMWFSKDLPHTSMDCLTDRPIPSDDFSCITLTKLIFPQRFRPPGF